MPWLPFYADHVDFAQIIDWLNNNDQLAFLVSDGPRRWRAISDLDSLTSSRVCLWHVPSGLLPLLHPNPRRDVSLITDPWSGWEELRTGADPSTPFFGAGHPGVVWFNHRPVSLRNGGGIGLSSYEWIGNHYRLTGNPATPATESFWKLLRKWTQKLSTRIPREGLLDGPRPEIYAFQSAHRAFKSGTQRDNNP
jgi:hypothetical protein